jgi:hypothetical protein
MKPELTLIETIVTRGLPLLSADEANKKVIELILENMRLRAQIDAVKMVKEGKI